MKKGLKHSRLPSGMIRVRYKDIDEYLAGYYVDEKNIIDEIVDEVIKNF